MEEKNLQLERLVFFSDAVVAIAITLLALDIRIDETPNGHLSFGTIWHQWHKFLAFALSFFNIASFWKTHHTFFAYIKKIDERLLGFNILWLLFIVLLPFTTSLISNYFFDVAAMSIYSLIILIISIFQNIIWDYACNKKFLSAQLNPLHEKRIRALCNLDMINGIIGLAVSFFSPVIAFILLFTKLPITIMLGLYYRRIRRKSGSSKSMQP